MATGLYSAAHRGYYRSVSIATTRNGNLEVDEDALFRVLNPSKIGDRPIAIITIAGKNRTGKSFLLNFFIRYFREKGWRNSNWIGPQDKKVDDGFTWSGGSDPYTKGIDIWEEIFIIQRKDGSEIAVILMDTQGLFDTENSADTNAKILSLSALCSSHMILNVKNLINKLDLEHLQFCIAYAREAARRGHKKESKFQNLTFLIRDWENEAESGYGADGGRQYLGKCLLQTSGVSEEIREVKTSINQAFESTACFLMPHPGLKIPRMKNIHVTNADLEKDFVKYLKQLTEYVLHPDNLIIKTIGGNQATISGLRNLLAAVANSFRRGQMPHVGTILETIARASNTEALESAMKSYGRKMQESHKRFVDERTLQIFHQTAERTARAEFDEKSFDSSNNDSYRQQLARECRQKFERAKERNRQMKNLLKYRLEEEARSCSKKYDAAMRKVVERGQTVSDSELEMHDNRIRRSFIDQFKKEAEASGLPSCDVNPYRREMENAMNDAYSLVKRESLRDRETNALAQERGEMMSYRAHTAVKTFRDGNSRGICFAQREFRSTGSMVMESRTSFMSAHHFTSNGASNSPLDDECRIL